MGIVKGIIPVIPTPFSDDGKSVDYRSFEKLIEMAISDGAHALCLFAAGAEFYKLAEEERKELFWRAVCVNDGRIPIVATVASHATVLAVQEAHWYEKEGVDALNIMPPGFASPSQSMIAEHLKEIGRDVNVPVIIQYAPALNGLSIASETFAAISEGMKKELYIKLEASPTGPAISALRKATEGRYEVIVGDGGECMYEALKRGACAVMPGAALIRPYRMIFDAFEKGDDAEAFDLFNRYLPHIHLMQRDIESFVAMEKVILMKRGILKNCVCRKPNNYPDEQTLEFLEQHVKYVCREFSLPEFLWE